jgi:cytochrome c biogenesis protein CcdA
VNQLLDPIVNGFLLGMTTGPLCLTACLPVLISVTLSEGKERAGRGTWIFLGKFIAGRFIAYLFLGVLIGLGGSHVAGLGQKVGTYAWMVLAFILIAYGMELLTLPHLGMCRLAGRTTGHRAFPFILGGLTGLSICPPLLLAVTYSLQKADYFLFGILFFAAFFIATTLYILPLGLAGRLPVKVNAIMVRVGRVMSVAVGIFFLYQGLAALRIT